jgi:hypothetical protein
MVLSLAGLGTKNHCADEDQQHISYQSVSLFLLCLYHEKTEAESILRNRILTQNFHTHSERRFDFSDVT